jgi:hypothetical protein
MKMHHNLNKISAKGFHMLAFRGQFRYALEALQRGFMTIVSCLFVVSVAVGCASTKVTSREQLVTEQLPRPAHIWVYDFAATAADLPADSTLAGQYSEDSTAQTAEYTAIGRDLGAQIASQLVEQIRGMGLPAARAVAGTAPQINDIVIRGYLISFEEGNTAKRLVIGFGSGSSELKVAAEGFQMTAQGLRKLGSGTTASGGSKSPGTAVSVAGTIATHNPAGLIISSGVKVYGEKSGSSKVEGRAKQTAKEIADVLRERFKQMGWVS